MPTTRWLRDHASLILIASLALWLAACSDVTDPRPVERFPVATVELNPVELDLTVGGDRALDVTLRAGNGVVLDGRTITWTTADPTVATVSSAGVVHAVGAGTTVVTAQSEGRLGATTLRVHATQPEVETVEIEGAAELFLAVGGMVELRARARAGNGMELPGRTATWTSDLPAIASVSSSGAMVAQAIGSTRITATIAGRSASVLVTVYNDSPGFDLMFDMYTGHQNSPQIFRMSPNPPNGVPMRITLDWAAQVAPSPDGTRIAFTCREIHGTAICVANADGTDIRIVTPATRHADQPAWSPDGTRIAYRSWEMGATPGPFNPTRIWVMNADGSGKAALTANSPAGTWQESPTWSPAQADGSYRIAFSQQSIGADGYRRGRISSIRQDGTDWKNLTVGGPYLEDEPAWSPVGNTIAFTRTGGTAAGDLWLVAGNGGSERPLMSQNPADEQRSPAWSPDGLLIAFTSKHEVSDGNSWRFQIYTVRGDGSELVRRTSVGGDKHNVAWIRR